MGTPEFAVPALRTLAGHHGTEIDLALVVTQPDRPAGRGNKLTPPPVKVAAEELGLPVLQAATLRDPEARQRIIDLEPDLIVVAAFGMILGRWILELPTRGCVNLHASLLPKYRGANPICVAIHEGDATTGVSLMQMNRGLDTGAFYAQAAIPIEPDDTTASLTPKLAELAASLLDDQLTGLLRGELLAIPQPEGASLTRQLVKADGWIDWSRSAEEIARQVRAMWPWPRTWTTLPDGTVLQIHTATVDVSSDAGTVGELVHAGVVRTGDGDLLLERIQLPGGKPLERAAIRNHPALQAGVMLGTGEQPEVPGPIVVPVEPSA